MINIKSYPYLIAEAGVSHFGSLDKAIELLDASIEANCDAFKIQVFNVDKLFANDAKGWKNRLKDRMLTIGEIKKISEICERKKIDFIITPHDDHILPFLKEIKINALKIGSGEVGNLSFISECFKYCDHLIYSTGLSEIKDINNVVEIANSKGKNLSILHCNTAYPTKDRDVNLSVIRELILKYPNNIIGYSDHTQDQLACLNSICFGARIIERHITLEKNIPNAQDWKVASLPDELKELRSLLNRTYDQIGSNKKNITLSAKENIFWACKSPYLTKKVNKGEKLTNKHYVMKRPFTGTTFEDIQKLEDNYCFNQNLLSGSELNLTYLSPT